LQVRVGCFRNGHSHLREDVRGGAWSAPPWACVFIPREHPSLSCRSRRPAHSPLFPRTIPASPTPHGFRAFVLHCATSGRHPQGRAWLELGGCRHWRTGWWLSPQSSTLLCVGLSLNGRPSGWSRSPDRWSLGQIESFIQDADEPMRLSLFFPSSLIDPCFVDSREGCRRMSSFPPRSIPVRSHSYCRVFGGLS
jgi:hypothetical protein